MAFGFGSGVGQELEREVLSDFNELTYIPNDNIPNATCKGKCA